MSVLRTGCYKCPFCESAAWNLIPVQRCWQEDKAGRCEPLAEAFLGAGAGKKAETEPEKAVRLSSKRIKQ